MTGNYLTADASGSPAPPRRQRALDAAADLLVRYGYRRVTVEDVARACGIGKGTVYLHWASRDDLFKDVFRREIAAAVGELLDQLRGQPGTWRPHRFVRAYFMALMTRPLLTGLALDDADLLGRLTAPDGGPAVQQHQDLPREYIRLLVEHNVIRPELDADAAADTLLAVLEGFIRHHVTVARDGGGREVADSADLLALTVRNALETGARIPARREAAIASAVADLVAGLATPEPDPKERPDDGPPTP